MCFPLIPFQWTVAVMCQQSVCVTCIYRTPLFRVDFCGIVAVAGWCQHNNDGSAKPFCLPFCVDYTQLILLFDRHNETIRYGGTRRGPSDHSNPALSQTSKLFLPSSTLSAKCSKTFDKGRDSKQTRYTSVVFD